jgi:hypothetical protein
MSFLWNIHAVASQQKTTAMSKYSLSIIHPSFESLKNACRLLHFMAAAFIAINAAHQLAAHEGSKLICYTQFVIAADILILVFMGTGLLAALPKVGVLFRLIESLTFLGISLTLFNEAHPYSGAFHALLSGIYFFICYREWRVSVSEAIEIKSTGITIPDFMISAEISWLHIKKVVADYNSIIIETARNKKVRFQLRRNLKIEELEQINDFCSLHSQLSS